MLKLIPNESAGESVSKIDTASKRYIPSAPFDYKFIDSEVGAEFAVTWKIFARCHGQKLSAFNNFVMRAAHKFYCSGSKLM